MVGGKLTGEQPEELRRGQDGGLTRDRLENCGSRTVGRIGRGQTEDGNKYRLKDWEEGQTGGLAGGQTGLLTGQSG